MFLNAFLEQTLGISQVTLRNSSQIGSFSLESLFEAEHKEKLQPTNQTKNKFYLEYENAFLVLPDNKTIVGVDAKTRVNLVVEDISTNKASFFGKHSDIILSLLYDKTTSSLFVGEYGGKIIQYQKERNNQVFNIVKDYGCLDLGGVNCCTQIGEYAIFGGDTHCLVAINIRERRVCEDKIESPYMFVASLQVCHSLSSKVYLSLGTDDPYICPEVPDILDMTLLYEKQKIGVGSHAKEINEILTIHPRKQTKMTFQGHATRKRELFLSQKKTLNQGTRNKRYTAKE